jgi:hypothetical protein
VIAFFVKIFAFLAVIRIATLALLASRIKLVWLSQRPLRNCCLDQNQEKTQAKSTNLETDGDDARAGSSGWTQAAAQHIWQHDKATPAEVKFMTERGGVSGSQEADSVKAQMARTAVDPEAALVKAVQDNRVVGFADMHVRQGAYFQFLIDEMPKLKAAGVTDIALEMPKTWQKDINDWTPEGQKEMNSRLTDGQSLLDVVDAAKKAGLTVSAVDEYYTGPGDNIFSRDKTMADNIEQILQDLNKKVLYFVGAEHLSIGFRRATTIPTTAQRLRDDNVSVDTFYQQIPSLPDGMVKSTRDLTRPVSVDTKEADLLGAVRTTGFGQPPYGNFDNVIFYPLHYKMNNCEAELKQFGAAPTTALKTAVEDNRVVLLGEMKRADPEHPESQHRKLFSQMMPELKKSGLTDVALNIPARYQGQLDQYVKSGLPAGPLDLPAPLGGWENENFKPVLEAAISSGLKLHAIGEDITASTPVQHVIDGLAANLESLSKNNDGGKTLLWSEELFVAKFRPGPSEISISHTLKNDGIATTTIADFSQDFDKFSPGQVSQLLKKPVVVKPELTSHLKTIVNNQYMQMDRFDQVIVYPSE